MVCSHDDQKQNGLRVVRRLSGGGCEGKKGVEGDTECWARSLVWSRKGPRLDAQTSWGVGVMISSCNMRSSWSQQRGGCQLPNSPGVWEHRVGGGQGQASACASPETRLGCQAVENSASGLSLGV